MGKIINVISTLFLTWMFFIGLLTLLIITKWLVEGLI